ncbi:replication protein C, IncQ-type [Stutzerimonas chloritidismutans]
MNKFDLTHARHDPAHCLAPGLFRSLKRGERKKLKLDVTYRFGDDVIRFWGPEPLGCDDLRVLQGLVAMSAVSGNRGRGIELRYAPESEAGQQLRKWLDLKWDAIEKVGLVAKGSFRQLACELGYAEDGGSQLKTIRDSIERLWAVSMIIERGSKREGFRILSSYASDENAGKLFVAINPRLAEAVMGERPYTRIDMNEVRALHTGPARLIHQRLCGWIDPGKKGRVELDTICGYVWPDQGTAEAVKKRRQIARRALDELAALGWKLDEYVRCKWEIGRPQLSMPRCLPDGITFPKTRRNAPQVPA